MMRMFYQSIEPNHNTTYVSLGEAGTRTSSPGEAGRAWGQVEAENNM